ncbi:MAG: hypothetical protein J6V07_01615 [Clostridia bacterium]|nr:hypothetical protein [Clostridia bacterium]
MLPDDFHLETRYHYTQLNNSEKKLYLFLVELFLARKYRFLYPVFEESVPDDPEIRALPRFYFDHEEFVDSFKVYRAVLWDCPEFYYVCVSEMHFEENGVVSFLGAPGYTDEEIDHYNRLLDEILHRFDHIEDAFELELAVHDYILREFDYDDFDRTEAVVERGEVFHVVSLLKTGRGACAAFASLMQFVLQRRGVPVIYLVSTTKDDEEGDLHAWLAVKISGEYYHLDVTFNEGETQDPEMPQYTSFNITDAEAEEAYWLPREEYPDLVCTATEANYYHRRGLYFKTVEEIERALSAFCVLNEGKGEACYFYFRTAPELEVETVKQAVCRTIPPSVDGYRSTFYGDGDYYALGIHYHTS